MFKNFRIFEIMLSKLFKKVFNVAFGVVALACLFMFMLIFGLFNMVFGETLKVALRAIGRICFFILSLFSLFVISVAQAHKVQLPPQSNQIAKTKDSKKHSQSTKDSKTIKITKNSKHTESTPAQTAQNIESSTTKSAQNIESSTAHSVAKLAQDTKNAQIAQSEATMVQSPAQLNQNAQISQNAQSIESEAQRVENAQTSQIKTHTEQTQSTQIPQNAQNSQAQLPQTEKNTLNSETQETKLSKNSETQTKQLTQNTQNTANTPQNTESHSILSDLESAFSVYLAHESPEHFIKTKETFIAEFNKNELKNKSKNLKTDSINLVSNSPQATPATLSKKQTNIDKHIQMLEKDSIDVSTLSPKCATSTFNLRKENSLNLEEILNYLAKSCDFSVQYYKNKDAKIATNINALNIQNKSLEFILSMLLSDMYYDIKPHRLILKDQEMLTYELNYVSSTRMAQSNTDVLFSQDQSSYGMGFSGYGGYTGSGYGGYGGYSPSGGYGVGNNYTFTPPKEQSLSGYLDNLSLKTQLRNQMTYQNNHFGKSGTKIYSVDEINFWADIESKLGVLLDSRKGDRFMIDKGAGLVSIWTSRHRMKEVAVFLKSLESKMNLQVSIDVEILSLMHYNSNNIGIDWQEIFNILNPTQSEFSLSLANPSNFSIANSSLNLTSLFSLLKTYGNLRSLSNPKIMALNNQPAIISVGSVIRYSQNLVFQSNNTTNTIQNTSTQYPSVFSGILLDITPSINEDSIILRINPSITKTKDPELENTSIALNSPPNLSTNQLSTIVKLRNGQRVIIGGLLNNIAQNSNQVIPGLGELKGLDRIFGKASKLQRNEELIIIITPTIIM